MKRLTTAALVIALLAASVCTACTASRRAGTGQPVARSSTPTPTNVVPPAPTSVPTYTQYPVPSSVANDPAKREQVKVTGCSSTGSKAVATGAVHNTGTGAASYDITVFFTSSTATAVNYATTAVRVAAGATTDFTAQRDFAAPAELLCVLVGVS